MKATFAAFLCVITLCNFSNGVQLTCYSCDHGEQDVLLQVGARQLNYFPTNPNCGPATNLTATTVSDFFKSLDQFCYVVITYYEGKPFTISRRGSTREASVALQNAVQTNVMEYPLVAPSIGCTRKPYSFNGLTDLVMEVCVCYIDKCNGEPLRIGMPPPPDPAVPVPPNLSCLSCTNVNLPDRATVLDQNCPSMTNYSAIMRANGSVASSCVTAGIFDGDKLVAIYRYPTTVPVPADARGKCIQQPIGVKQYNMVYCTCSSNDCNNDFIDGCKCGTKYGQSSSSPRKASFLSVTSVPLLFLFKIAF